MVEFVGLTGPIKFDTEGLRKQFSLDLTELQMEGLVRHLILMMLIVNPTYVPRLK